MHLRAIVLALSAVCSACGAHGGPERVDDVLLVTLDTTRADALSCYGGSETATPNLLALSRESLRFDFARAVAPLTLPAHTSMMTGLYPPRHGVRDNGLGKLSSRATTLASLCAKAGLDTAAFVSALVLDRVYGLDRGFALYDQPERPLASTTSHYTERHATETVDRALAWLAKRPKDKRFFLWVHLFDAHVPYAPPPQFLERAKGNPYLGEIAYVDSELARLIAALRASGALDHTLVVVGADHRACRGVHGEATHAALCYDATLHIPLLVRFPDRWRAGEHDAHLASSVDVCPTVLDALGLPIPKELDGESLFGRAPDDSRGVYFESYDGYLNYGWSPLGGWCDAHGKYLASSKPEWFDPLRDPREEHDRIADHADDAKRARQAISKIYSSPRVEPEASQVGAEEIDALRRLGYAGGGRSSEELPSPLDASDRPSPSERESELEPLLVANAMIDAGRYADAIAPLEALAKSNAKHRLARDLLGLALMQLGRFPEAEVRLRERLALGSDRADTRINLAICRERSGDPDGAILEWRRVLELDPLEPQALEAVAKWLDQHDRAKEAAELRRRAADRK